MEDFIEITVDSHTMVRNETKRSHIPFIQFTSMVTFCKTIVQYHNQDINIDAIY